jgi:putative endonuclease
MAVTKKQHPWTTYMLKCADGTFYVGSTTDIERRLCEHNARAAGARYTKTRRPVVLIYSKKAASRSEAQKYEAALKRLSHAEKLLLSKA